MDTLEELARALTALPVELDKAQYRAVSKSALLVTRQIRAEIRRASGGDNRMSGVGARGAKVGARYKVSGGVNPSAIISATGPLHLLERDTAPRTIKPKRKKALRFTNGHVRALSNHPGTTGKHPFERAYLNTRDKTGPEFDKQVQLAIRRVL